MADRNEKDQRQAAGDGTGNLTVQELARVLGVKRLKGIVDRQLRELKSRGTPVRQVLLDGAAKALGYYNFANLQTQLANLPAAGAASGLEPATGAAAKSPALVAPDVELFIAAAEQHGQDDDPDHEVGDLQDHLRAAYALFTPEQRLAFAADCAVQETVANGSRAAGNELLLLATAARPGKESVVLRRLVAAARQTIDAELAAMAGIADADQVDKDYAAAELLERLGCDAAVIGAAEGSFTFVDHRGVEMIWDLEEALDRVMELAEAAGYSEFDALEAALAAAR